MTPEDVSPQDMAKDWRIMLMVRMIEIIQEHSTGFVPIVTPFKQEPENRMIVPQLSAILDIKKEELPNYFVLHPLTE